MPYETLRYEVAGPVATLTIDFHHELGAGQLVLVTGTFTRVGHKSFGYELRLHDADSMTRCASRIR